MRIVRSFPRAGFPFLSISEQEAMQEEGIAPEPRGANPRGFGITWAFHFFWLHAANRRHGPKAT
jgi:hypothetical protein